MTNSCASKLTASITLEELNPTINEIAIATKLTAGERLSPEDALTLYKSSNLRLLGYLATQKKIIKSEKHVFFNRNFHLEPTNVCVFTCSFCSFSRKLGEEGSWETSLDEVRKIAESYRGKPVTEVHIVGGVHPKRGVDYYCQMIRIIKEVLPDIHVKGFTAVELEVMFKRSRMTIEEGLTTLRTAGLNSLPGGGAEIFDPEIRNQICATKATGETWLTIHRTAHKLGIPSNCTMLYGHLEQYEHRIKHMLDLRTLQDETNGFNTFIPLKYRNENNGLSYLPETTQEEDLKNYAIARLFLDNIPHIKAYWPMIGRATAAKSLHFGVDDLDGTIDDTTKIYSMAGSEETNPSLSTDELISLITSENHLPVERDSLYRQFAQVKSLYNPGDTNIVWSRSVASVSSK
jgi:aminodeoxyfutalosine synthase